MEVNNGTDNCSNNNRFADNCNFSSISTTTAYIKKRQANI